jgi:CO/xanthine dehydrogenase Mo-binding subunit
MFLVQDNGPYGRSGDFLSGGRIASLGYQPLTQRFRGITVITNTPPRGAQRAPGGLQIVAMMEPLLHKAAKALNIDQIELRKINAPEGKAEYGPAGEDGTRRHATSAFVKEALDQGRELFEWDQRVARSGQRNGSKATGIGVAVSPYSGGSAGYDGLFTIRPDGRMYVHQGIGNLGTASVIDTARAACDVLGFPWDDVEIIWGNTAKHLPWSSSQSGSQTIHAHTRANHAAGLDAKRKLQEIAARDLGGSPDQYETGDQGVFRSGNPSRRLSWAQAARRAIQLGGQYDGHELPEDINEMTVASATALAGLGLMGVAKDNFGRDGDTYSYAVGLAEVEVDVETGHVRLVDYTVIGDVGIVVNPRGLAGQLHGGGVQGFGHAISQKWVYDQHWGLLVAKRFYSNKPTTILDIPLEMKWGAVDLPDPETPVGARGIGEPSTGAGAGAVLCAIADAVGEDHFRRMPITPDMIISALNDPSTDVNQAFRAHV